MPGINVIIPAYNEEKSIAKVIAAIPGGLADDVLVVNNNSSDQTAAAATAAGATVLQQPVPGYGNACLTGIAYAAAKSAASSRLCKSLYHIPNVLFAHLPGYTEGPVATVEPHLLPLGLNGRGADGFSCIIITL